MFPTLLAALAISAPVPKAQPIDLSWKFTKWDVFYVTHEFREEVTHVSTLDPQEQSGHVSVERVVYQLTVAATGGGKTVLQLEFVSGEYDSVRDGKQLEVQAIKGLAGRTATITLDSSGQFTSLEGVTEPNRPRGSKANAQLLEPNLRARLNAVLRAVPGERLKEGDTWETTHTESPAESDYYATHIMRTERGKVATTTDGHTKLAVELDTTLTTTHGPIESMRLTDKKGTRAVVFDAKAGRVRSVEESCILNGLLHLDLLLGGNDKLKATWKQTTKISVTDEKPKAKK